MSDGNVMPNSTCPFCKYVMDRYSAVGDSGVKAKPGDVSCCMRCGSFLVFGADMQLRALTLDEMDDIRRSPIAKELERLQREIRRFHAMRN